MQQASAASITVSARLPQLEHHEQSMAIQLLRMDFKHLAELNARNEPCQAPIHYAAHRCIFTNIIKLNRGFVLANECKVGS